MITRFTASWLVVFAFLPVFCADVSNAATLYEIDVEVPGYDDPFPITIQVTDPPSVPVGEGGFVCRIHRGQACGCRALDQPAPADEGSSLLPDRSPSGLERINDEDAGEGEGAIAVERRNINLLKNILGTMWERLGEAEYDRYGCLVNHDYKKGLKKSWHIMTGVWVFALACVVPVIAKAASVWLLGGMAGLVPVDAVMLQIGSHQVPEKRRLTVNVEREGDDLTQVDYLMLDSILALLRTNHRNEVILESLTHAESGTFDNEANKDRERQTVNINFLVAVGSHIKSEHVIWTLGLNSYKDYLKVTDAKEQ